MQSYKIPLSYLPLELDTLEVRQCGCYLAINELVENLGKHPHMVIPPMSFQSRPPITPPPWRSEIHLEGGSGEWCVVFAKSPPLHTRLWGFELKL